MLQVKERAAAYRQTYSLSIILPSIFQLATYTLVLRQGPRRNQRFLLASTNYCSVLLEGLFCFGLLLISLLEPDGHMYCKMNIY